MNTDLKDITILLVEDAAVMRKIELKILKGLGFKKIIEAENGNVAIAKLKEEKNIALIISDWNMPEKGGYELLVWVRADEKFKNIPFIMATAEGDMKQENKAVNAGVSGFIAKPFNADELKIKINEALGIKQKKDNADIEKSIPRETAAGKVRLKIAHIQITDHLILGALKYLIKKGDVTPKYFELETQCMSGWNPVKQSLAKGTVDAACILAPIAMDMFNFGVPIKLILLAHKNGSIFVRNKQIEYTEPFQNFFKQKTFLIPHKMSIHHMLSHMFFSKIGIKSGIVGEKAIDLSFEVVAPINMLEFLRGNPEACGFMVAEPLGTKAIAAGIADQMFLSSQLWENHPCCIVAMRNDFIDSYKDAVYEFTEMLVHAGKFIENKPEIAAEVAVDFLDPNKVLGLKIPILKNVLTEPQGIKTRDLYPGIEDLDIMQQYMVKNMGIGSLIELEKFVDTRFADAACKDRKTDSLPSKLHDEGAVALEILQCRTIKKGKSVKTMLGAEGKYLTFPLGNQEFGIDISKTKEVIRMIPLRTIPASPPFIKGVINLRDKVIPVMDLRLRFGMEEIEYNDRSCIIILEFETNKKTINMGIAIDSVTEVLDIKASEIEDAPSFGINLDTGYILGMAKMEGGIKILLDMEYLLTG